MKIGFTEQGDAGLNLSWITPIQNHQVDGAILITKQLNPKFCKNLMELWNNGYHNLILHCGCTGWGNTVIEPNVPPYQYQLNQLNELIKSGFPKDHCVLRIDPIWPTPNGINRALKVLEYADSQTNTKNIRIRISILDEYKHVKDRIQKLGYKPIYGNKFYAPKDMMQAVETALSNTGHTFECCAEPYLTNRCFIHKGCLSHKDLFIMGLPSPSPNTTQNPQNRNGCMCLSCKTELLNTKHPCPHKCIYCYWKD